MTECCGTQRQKKSTRTYPGWFLLDVAIARALGSELKFLLVVIKLFGKLDLFHEFDNFVAPFLQQGVETCCLRAFGKKPKEASSPLTKGDHPELHFSELLQMTVTQRSAAFSLELHNGLANQIGRFDIVTAFMTMSRFRAAQRIGHAHETC